MAHKTQYDFLIDQYMIAAVFYVLTFMEKIFVFIYIWFQIPFGSEIENRVCLSLLPEPQSTLLQKAWDLNCFMVCLFSSITSTRLP